VNATESLDRGIEQNPDVLRLAHVSLNGQRPSTAGFDGLNDLLRGISSACVVDNDSGACLC